MANRILASSATPVPLENIDPSQVVQGDPQSGALELPDSGFACGLWEHTAGTSTDVEVDEVFVVLSGHAHIIIEGQDPIEVSPGDVVELTAGTRTTWHVHAPLRKFWIARD